MTQGRVLAIAGSDSSGGAGLEADQKTIAAHGCYAMTATTALTAQNTQGVVDIHEVPPAFVRKQIDACISDIGVDVVKTGMLTSAKTIEMVADAISHWAVPLTVVDPVMVSTSGSQLLPKDAVQAIRLHLLPKTTVFTPNLPEAKLILEDAGLPVSDISCLADFKELAKSLSSLGPDYVLLKGGHLPLREDGQVATVDAERQIVVDVLCGKDEVTHITKPFQVSKNTHGTGCSLASAIASNLANKLDVVAAVTAACRYVEAGIKTATDIGHGNGPINHFHSTFSLPFAPGYFLEYLLNRPDVAPAWKRHVEHIFVGKMADGTLPVENFKYYLIQDYLYLIQFARANALAAVKAKTMTDVAAAANIVGHIHREMKLHINYCKDFGVSQEQMEATEEHQACTAYTRYVLDIGNSEDWLALQIAMAPCLIGYGQIALRLSSDPNTKREGNMYSTWIQNYASNDYQEAVQIGSALLERHACQQSPSRIEELVKIFIHATNMETGFWDMGDGNA